MFHPSTKTLSRYLDGRLSGRAAGRIARHIEKCGGCRGRLHDLELMGRALVPARESSPLLREKILSRVKGEDWNRERVCGEIRNISGEAMVEKIRGKATRGFPGMAVKKGDTLEVPKGSGALIELCDGSSLYCNGETRIQFPSGAFDLALDAGEIFAMMRRQSSVFKIKTPHAMLGVLGTDFTAEVSEGEKTILSVLKGRVSFENKSGKTIVAKNRRVEAGKHTPPESVKISHPGDIASWIHPLKPKTERRWCWRYLTIPALLIVILLSLRLLFFQPVAKQPEPPVNPAFRKLIDAFGYAASLNPEKAETLCIDVLKESRDPKIRNRAHWVMAVGYARFAYEYRSMRYMEQYEREKDYLVENAPDLPGDILAAHEVCLEFLLQENPDPDEILNRARSVYRDGETDDPTDVFRLGYTYWMAAHRTGEDAPMLSREYLLRAGDLLKGAMILKPESREYAAHYITLLIEMKRGKQARRAALRQLEKYDRRYPGVQVRNRSPFCIYSETLDLADPAKGAELENLYSSAVGFTDLKKGGQLLMERTKLASADAWTHSALTQYRAQNLAGDSEEKRRLWEDLVGRFESGEISAKGGNMRALASALNKLARYQRETGRLEEALGTYEKLEQISPHYGDIHLSRGTILERMAREEENMEKRELLFSRALEEYRIQTGYNWRGEAAGKAGKALDRLGAASEYQER